MRQGLYYRANESNLEQRSKSHDDLEIKKKRSFTDISCIIHCELIKLGSNVECSRNLKNMVENNLDLGSRSHKIKVAMRT